MDGSIRLSYHKTLSLDFHVSSIYAKIVLFDGFDMIPIPTSFLALVRKFTETSPTNLFRLLVSHCKDLYI